MLIKYVETSQEKQKVVDYSRFFNQLFRIKTDGGIATRYASHHCPVTLIILNATGQRWLAYLY